MTTGTPLDLTPFGVLLSGIGVLYWLAALAGTGLALWLPRPWWLKLVCAAAVLTGFAYPVATHIEAKRETYDAAKAKLDQATAMFNERCKTAGERIVRTVENVDGVRWMKWREATSNADNFAAQFKLNDPYGSDCGAEDCIQNLLRATAGVELDPQRKLPHHKGYAWVESADPRDGQLIRYTLRIFRPNDRDPKWIYDYVTVELVKQPIEAYSARYGITWDDISTREDRDYWIAGGSIKVIDLRTNEVIAERIGYMMDRGQGSEAGFRSPWLLAAHTACPSFDRSESNSPIKASQSRSYVFRVLSFKQGE